MLVAGVVLHSNKSLSELEFIMDEMEEWEFDVNVARAEELGHSRRLDVHRWSDHQEVNSFVAEIFDQISSAGNPRIRREHVKVVLLDLYVAWCDDPTLKISFSRSPNEYRAGSIYNELKISRTTIDVVDELRSSDFVEFAVGFNDRNSGIGRYSRMWPTDLLIEKFRDARFEKFDIGNDPTRVAVKLHDNDGGSVEYTDNEETIRMGNVLAPYNDLLRMTYISIPNLSDMKIALGNPVRGEQRFLQVSQNHKFICRVFSRNSFELGG